MVPLFPALLAKYFKDLSLCDTYKKQLKVTAVLGQTLALVDENLHLPLKFA